MAARSDAPLALVNALLAHQNLMIMRDDDGELSLWRIKRGAAYGGHDAYDCVRSGRLLDAAVTVADNCH